MRTHLSEVADFIDAMKNSFAEFVSRRPAAPVERQNKTSLLDLEESILQEFRREQAMAFRQRSLLVLKSISANGLFVKVIQKIQLEIILS